MFCATHENNIFFVTVLPYFTAEKSIFTFPCVMQTTHMEKKKYSNSGV